MDDLHIALARMETKLDSVICGQAEFKTKLYGNGKPGLIQTVHDLEQAEFRRQKFCDTVVKAVIGQAVLVLASLFFAVFGVGCSTIDPGLIGDIADAIEDAQDKPTVEPIPEPGPAPGDSGGDDLPDDREWRRDVASIDGLSWKTRGLTKAPGNGRNKDGGFEWIVARLTGEGFDRCLIMVMGGSRPPSRIYYQAGESSFQNSVFPVPMEAEADWQVVNDGGRFTVKLNGKAIYSNRGTVRKVTMNGYRNRESTGEWR